jgi:DNA methylase
MTDAHLRLKERKRCARLGIPVPEWASKQSRRGGGEQLSLQANDSRPLKRLEMPPAIVSSPLKQGDARALVRELPLTAYLISDPPYNQKYHYDVYDDDVSSHEYAELIRLVFQGRRSVIVHYPEETLNVLTRAGLGDVQEVMAWVYPSNQAKQHRLATWWNCKPDWSKTPQAYKNPTDKRVAALIAAGKAARGYDWVEINHVKNVANAGHPCPLPYELAERLVLATTEPGDLVCDPFAGSGTVLLAALRNGRRAIGFELSEAYCQLASVALSGVPDRERCTA